MAISDIHYLRWVRSLDTDSARIPLILSGMTSPPADFLAGLEPRELLEGDHGDHPALAHALAESWDMSPAGILIQPGSHWNILLAVAARLDAQPGPVVVESPTYEPLRRIPAALGASVLRLPRRAEDGYALDLDRLAELAAARPSVLLISHPHNPTGVPLSDDEITALADWSRDCGAAVISDEVYLEFLDDPERQTLRRRLEGALSVRSFTKVLGLGGIRCSASAGPTEWIARAAALTDYGPVLTPTPTQAVAARAWEHREALWDRARSAAREGRVQVQRWAAALEDDLQLELPERGIICFPRVRAELHEALVAAARADGVAPPFGFGLDDHPGGSHEWIEHLRRQSGVLVSPGAFFEDPTGFRLGFGGPPEMLEEGLRALAGHLHQTAS